jgi:hypothetical protein
MTKVSVRFFALAKSLPNLLPNDYYSVALVLIDSPKSLWNYDGLAKPAND